MNIFLPILSVHVHLLQGVKAANSFYVTDLQLKGSVKEPNILIYFFFPTQLCSASDVLFTGGRGVSDFSVLKYY